MSTHRRRRARASETGDSTSPGSGRRAKSGVAPLPGGERWRRDGSVKMAASSRQHRNTRRHPGGRATAAEAQRPSSPGADPAASSAPVPRGRKPLSAEPLGPLGCGRSAGARARVQVAAERLTPGGSRIGSSSENSRKSEGFDGSPGSMRGARGAAAVSDRSTRAGQRESASGWRGPRAGRLLETATPHAGAEFRPPAAARDGAAEHTCGARGQRSRPLAPSCRQPVRRRGIRLAVASSRVRFRLGRVPGIEERAG
jgi:hypothetical protein